MKLEGFVLNAPEIVKNVILKKTIAQNVRQIIYCFEDFVIQYALRIQFKFKIVVLNRKFKGKKL